MKRLSMLLILVLALPLFATTPKAAKAAETTSVAQTQAQPAEAKENYMFTAKEAHSLSLIARKSLQIYDQTHDNVKMSMAQAMFAETHIVQDMGSPWLEVGQKVTIDPDLIEKYAVQSQTLSAEEIAAWQPYADQADFVLLDVSPDSTITSSAQTGENVDGSQRTVNIPDWNGETQPQQSDAPQSRSGAPWYWWLIGAGVLGLLYYLMGGRQGDGARPAKAVAKQTHTRTTAKTRAAKSSTKDN